MSLSPVARSSTFTQSLLLAAVGVTALGQTLVFTLLPSLGRATGLAEIQVGLIISGFFRVRNHRKIQRAAMIILWTTRAAASSPTAQAGTCRTRGRCCARGGFLRQRARRSRSASPSSR